jgi:hypothetical protein
LGLPLALLGHPATAWLTCREDAERFVEKVLATTLS